MYAIKPMKDLETFFKNAPYYNQDLPLESVKQVRQMGSNPRYQADSHRVNSRVAVFTAYTEADETVDTTMIPSFIKNHFPIHSIFSYPADENIPHQITVRNFRKLWI